MSRTVGNGGEEEVLSLLGLARRAGAVAAGTDATRAAVARGVAHCVVLAGDASEAQKEKVLNLLRHRKIPQHGVASGDALGAALGKGTLTAVAVTDAHFAHRLGRILSRGGEGGSEQRR